MLWLKLQMTLPTGTRGAMDMIEIPSHFFEHFLTSPQGLKYCFEDSLGDSIPQSLAESLQKRWNLLPALNFADSVSLYLDWSDMNKLNNRQKNNSFYEFNSIDQEAQTMDSSQPRKGFISCNGIGWLSIWASDLWKTSISSKLKWSHVIVCVAQILWFRVAFCLLVVQCRCKKSAFLSMQLGLHHITASEIWCFLILSFTRIICPVKVKSWLANAINSMIFQDLYQARKSKTGLRCLYRVVWGLESKQQVPR